VQDVPAAARGTFQDRVGSTFLSVMAVTKAGSRLASGIFADTLPGREFAETGNPSATPASHIAVRHQGDFSLLM
jgi:hypothetical protein